MVCGTHVHVAVDDGEAIGIIDRIRPWLLLIAALSTISPYDQGIDTGCASWRSQTGGRVAERVVDRVIADSAATLDRAIDVIQRHRGLLGLLDGIV